MSDVLCLGHIIILLDFLTPIVFPDSAQAAFLHRGTCCARVVSPEHHRLFKHSKRHRLATTPARFHQWQEFLLHLLGQSWTTLKHHQCQALQFFLNNEFQNNNKLHDFWMHHNKKVNPCPRYGLGENLDNINVFARNVSHVCCNPDHLSLGHPFELVERNPSHTLIIQNPNANKTAYVQKLRAQHMLCLSGTPFQNCLADVQSLISHLKIWPSNQDWIYWRQHLILGMNVGDRHAVQTLNTMMEIVSLQRTKQATLNLPKKIEKAIIVWMAERWERFSKDLHKEFIHCLGDFGRQANHGTLPNPSSN
ncbi:hypothetical protein VP01_60g8 [Puccinia sorghi]|uniref:SNF2 N-terminal domain-containing protein n=1 Tax=Puccinia sorghi TaxID=27349 RepID=A0A0L6UH32_9BASI|nr:hypothetical protein VP01_60g8 [Puccinia sorghi]